MEKYWKVVQTFQPRYQSGKYANHLKFFTLPPSWIYHQVELVFGSPNKLRVGKLQKLPPRIFAYHLHKALTNWLLRVNSYQPWTQLEKKIAKIKKKPILYTQSLRILSENQTRRSNIGSWWFSIVWELQYPPLARNEKFGIRFVVHSTPRRVKLRRLLLDHSKPSQKYFHDRT